MELVSGVPTASYYLAQALQAQKEILHEQNKSK